MKSYDEGANPSPIHPNNSIREMLSEIDPNMIIFDGLDESIIGWAYDWHSQNYVVVYDYNKMVRKMMDQNRWTYEDARDYVDFNIVGAYLGEQTPIVMYELKPRKKSE